MNRRFALLVVLAVAGSSWAAGRGKMIEFKNLPQTVPGLAKLLKTSKDQPFRTVAALSLDTMLRERGHELLETAFLGQYCESVPAQMRTGGDWYRGSADAIWQNLNLITDESPDLVYVFGADHVYQMDMRQMEAFHVAKRADCTVAAIPVPIEEGHDFGMSGPMARCGSSWRSRRTRPTCRATRPAAWRRWATTCSTPTRWCGK